MAPSWRTRRSPARSGAAATVRGGIAVDHQQVGVGRQLLEDGRPDEALLLLESALEAAEETDDLLEEGRVMDEFGRLTGNGWMTRRASQILDSLGVIRPASD